MEKDSSIYSAPQGDRKSQVIQAAAFIFKEKGYGRTTLQDIANEIGITKATLYYYFKNKHDLLFEITDKSITDAISRMTHIVEQPITVEEKIELAFQQHFKFYSTHHPGASVMLHEKTNFLPPEMEENIQRKFREYITLWEKILIEGVEQGVVRQDIDIKIMRWAAIGMCNWVYKWASSDGRLQFNEIAEMFTKIFKEGVLIKG